MSHDCPYLTLALPCPLAPHAARPFQVFSIDLATLFGDGGSKVPSVRRVQYEGCTFAHILMCGPVALSMHVCCMRCCMCVVCVLHECCMCLDHILVVAAFHMLLIAVMADVGGDSY